MNIKRENFRKDFTDFFKLTDILKTKQLKHTPFIVLDEEKGITLCFNALDLVQNYEMLTEVLVQWTGQWRSDYFLLTVGDVKLALLERGILN